MKEIEFKIADEDCHNFIISGADTDSIKFTKKDGKKFTEEEETALIDNINTFLPDLIRYEPDGIFKRMVYVKAKNYAYTSYKKPKNIKISGSGLKATTKEIALKEFNNKIIQSLIDKNMDLVYNIYMEYVSEIITDKFDISRWCSKKTVTVNVLNPKRTTEQNLLNAIKGKNLNEGDKFLVYFSNDENTPVKMLEDYNNDHDVEKLLQKLYNSMKVFETVIQLGMIPNYNLKKNFKLL
jgi:hypothetical protein